MLHAGRFVFTEMYDLVRRKLPMINKVRNISEYSLLTYKNQFSQNFSYA